MTTPNQRNLPQNALHPDHPPHGPSLAGRLVLIGVLAGGVVAQDRGGRLDEAERILPRVARAERVVLPTRAAAVQPVNPGLTRGEDWSGATGVRAAALPEGSFLIERAGRVIEGPHGRRVFVPTGEAQSGGEGPMLLLPCAALERLEMTLSDGDIPVRVSGEVFVYRNRRHLLVSSFLAGAGEPEPAAEEPVEPEDAGEAPVETPAEEPEDPASLMDDPDVRGLLEELESEPAAGAGQERSESAQAQREADGGAGVPLLPDGTPVVRRRGRLSRMTDGAWAFVFDNDEADAMSSNALGVLPCLLLQRIEREAFAKGEGNEVILSGRVYAYGGQSYLLPTMVVRVRGSGISSVQ